MATPREIRRRIASIKNTRKITKAMEVVASVKLRNSRGWIQAARPYSEKMAEITRHLCQNITDKSIPFLYPREVKKIGLVVVSSDKGLCGGFNANVIKKAQEFIREHNGTEVTLILLGKKCVEFFKSKKVSILDKYPDIFFKPNYDDAVKISEKIQDYYMSEQIDQLDIMYNKFKSAG